MIFKNETDAANSINVAIGASLFAIGASTAAAVSTYEAKLAVKVAAGTLSRSDKELKVAKAKLLLTNIMSLTSSFVIYYFSNDKYIKPSAVVGGIPVGTVEELSHALSDRVVKYRATGGVFLAHQDGGNQSLRIVLKAWGPNRYQFLNMLDMIFLYGQGKIIDLFETEEHFSKIELDTNTFKKVDPWHDFNKYNIDEGREEFHLTIPIITRNRVYTSMYLETYDTVETIEKGRSSLTISLFLRKYIPPLPYEFAYTGGNNDISGSLTTENLLDRQVKPRKYYREKSPESPIEKLLSHIDVVGDFALTTLLYINQLMDRFDPDLSGRSIEQTIALTYASNMTKNNDSGRNIKDFSAREILLGL